MTTEKALTDAQIETLIENSGGYWREDTFLIDCGEQHDPTPDRRQAYKRGGSVSAPKHESAGNEVTADGIVHRCSCGWVSPPCFSNAAASCLGIDHRAQAKPTNGEGA